MFKYINYLTIAFLPVYLFKIPLTTGVSINLLDILLLVSIFFNLFQITQTGNLKEFFSVRLSIKLALFFFTFGYLFSFFENFEKSSFFDTLGLLKSFLILPILFSLTSSFLVYKKELFVKYFLYSFVFMTSTLSVFGFFYFFSNLLTFDGRLEIFFNSPNALAMLLGPGIIIILFFLSKSHGYFYAFLLTLLFFHTFSTIATSSSGSFFSLFTLFALFAFTKSTKLSLLKIYPFFILATLLFSTSVLFLSPLLKKTNYPQNIPPSSFDSRIVIYDVTRQIISTNFVFGVGPGNFQNNYLLKQSDNPPYPQWAVPHPHNNLLLIIVEGGILVLFGYLLFIFSNPKIKKMSFDILLIFVLFYFLLHGIVDTTFWKNDLSVIFWLLIGFLNFYKK